ncbi:ImmA/IrrE family metallo-endopeptidase [Salinicola acroporae]|uniref:IrrE N-terminal-like domain-containing protein n=1 Tax=Salinicola acroporae TaxID=1541440 RepID=A0ABT6I064_9GAMM|nr:ImmA/IrrE family metallo-endopeptidase [Salinicola acroporae]MDH4571117.1 hypothetical protein [Salinicola acroporae]
MTTETAIRTAQKALDIAWDGKLPIDPTAIARSLQVTNGDSRLAIIMEGDPSLGPHSGQAEYVMAPGGDYYRCTYNSREASYRQQFTKAHELGHVLMGHVVPGKSPKRDTTFNAPAGDWDEVDANAFAAELLMPKDYVIQMANKVTNISKLAEIFGVSPTAIRYRLQNLGLL